MSTTPDRILEGTSVVLTRTREQATALSSELERLGARVISFPTIAIRDPASWTSLDQALSGLAEYDWLVFSSPNAVDFFLRRVRELEIDTEILHRINLAAVGTPTRARLEAEGLTVEFQPAESRMESLVKELRDRINEADPAKVTRILVPSSDLARVEIWELLRAEGVLIDVVNAYRNALPEYERHEIDKLLDESMRGYIIFASPSSIVNLARLFGVEDLAAALSETNVISIGPTTSEVAGRYGLRRILQSREATTESIIELITKDVRERR